MSSDNEHASECICKKCNAHADHSRKMREVFVAKKRKEDAAPDMFEALSEMVETHRAGVCSIGFQYALDKARVALAKAGGK